MILIISANFYTKVCDYLLDGTIDALNKNKYEILEIPGIFEIPAALNFAIESKKYNGFILLGCVIKGETDHYDFICNSVFNTLLKIIVKEKIACGLGILTVKNMSQAMDRANKKKENIGGNAANAALKMIEVKKHFTIN